MKVYIDSDSDSGHLYIIREADLEDRVRPDDLQFYRDNLVDIPDSLYRAYMGAWDAVHAVNSMLSQYDVIDRCRDLT